MKDIVIDKIIKRIHDNSLPECPINLETNVLRKIQQRSLPDESTLGWLNLLFNKTGFVISTFAIVVILSSIVSVSLIKLNYLETTNYLANKALGFNTVTDSQSFQFIIK